jgi:hypothetical protein
VLVLLFKFFFHIVPHISGISNKAFPAVETGIAADYIENIVHGEAPLVVVMRGKLHGKPLEKRGRIC